MGARADAVIAALAAKQHGVVARSQLLGRGLERHLIDRRIRAGMLQCVHAGVYQVGPVGAPLAWAMAALLACPASILSYRSAARLWRMLANLLASEPIDVSFADSATRGRRVGIRAHRARLAPDEVTRVEGVRVTTPARTRLDLGRVSSPRELERALAFAERERLVTRDALRTLLERHRGRAGTSTLALLVATNAPVAHTQSHAEEKLLALLQSGGIADAQLNVHVCGFQVDCYWPHARLIIEVDGFAYHSSTPAFVRDHQRDAAPAAAGIQVLRLSWHQIGNERGRTLVQIAQTLARSEERLRLRYSDR